MSSCLCIVQQGQIDDDRQAALRTMLASFSATHLGAPIPVQWIEVAPGSGYTAGEPSTTSFVSFVADRPLLQDTRVNLLEQLSASWAERAGCTLDEVLAVLADPA